MRGRSSLRDAIARSALCQGSVTVSTFSRFYTRQDLAGNCGGDTWVLTSFFYSSNSILQFQYINTNSQYNSSGLWA